MDIIFLKCKCKCKCKCEEPPFNYLDYKSFNLGEDKNGAEVSINKCNECGTSWVNYLIEEAHYSNSGRWWRAKLNVSDMKIDEAKTYIQTQKWCFIGGSFHNSTGKMLHAPIKIR